MSEKIELNDRVSKELQEGEKILWTGKPQQFALMTEETKKGLVTRWIVCAAVAVAILVAYFIANASSDQGVKAGFFLVCLVAPLYLALMPVLDKRSICKNCRYYVSDKHVIIDYAEKETYVLGNSCLRSEIIENDGGTVTVMLGSLAGMKPEKRRAKAVVPAKDDAGNICGMVIYNIDAAAKKYFAF